ncbi:unnamed protein product [Diplocarpon coronariae]|uniref:Uncharacterized protein n=1 Tax=Diplocarpon coronariae TaxID=2795749 RepID=A0A218Z768_9HELO|nr:hypothetical protein B2J93_7630 [Marssonina coronariae]
MRGQKPPAPHRQGRDRFERGAWIANEDPHGEYALVSKAVDVQHKLTGTTLGINSPQLLATLKEVVRYYPGEPLDFGARLAIEDRYMTLVHHREEIRPYGEVVGDATIKAHVALLLGYLDTEAGAQRG